MATTRARAVTLAAAITILGSCAADGVGPTTPQAVDTTGAASDTTPDPVVAVEPLFEGACRTGDSVALGGSPMPVPGLDGVDVTIVGGPDTTTFTFDGVDLVSYLDAPGDHAYALVRMSANDQSWLVASHTATRTGAVTPAYGAELSRYGYTFDDVGELVTDDVVATTTSSGLELVVPTAALRELGTEFTFTGELSVQAGIDGDEWTIAECEPTTIGDPPPPVVPEPESAGVLLVSEFTDPDESHWAPSTHEPTFQSQVRVFDGIGPHRIPEFPYTQNGCGTRQIRVRWRSLGPEVISGYSFWSDVADAEAAPATEGTLVVGGCEDAMFRTVDGTIADIVAEVSVYEPAVG